MPTINNRFENLTLERLQEIYDIVSIPVSTGLTVGVTTITGGTVGRVLFEGTGNVLQESGNLFWNATNNRLGIGTSTPNDALHVIGGGIFSSALTISGGFTMTEASNVHTFTAPATNRTIRFITNSQSYSLFPTGNFAIGTTTDSGYKIDVNGTTRLAGNTLIASAAVQLGSENAKLKVLSGYEGGTMNGVLVEANGATYTTILRHTGSASGSLYIDATNAGLAAMTRAIYINGSSALANYVTFAESGNQRFNISRAGDTTISGNLYKTVNNIFLGLYGGPSGGTVDGFIKIHGGSNFWGMIQFNMGYDATNSKMTWTLSDTTELMRLTGGGNLLLGTSTNAGYKLDVNGVSRIGGPGGSAQLYLKGLSGTGQYLYFDNGSVANGMWTMVGSTVFAFDSATTRVLRISPSAQVTINGNTNIGSAQLQVDSTTRGFLPPRMTTTEKNGITSLVAGLIVYDATLNKLCVYTGTVWETITSA